MCDNRKSRRSSILKLPKQRTPLCDVDFNPPTRRVSFANSNFIKEFTADPEKNTIWHNSYEESINSVNDVEKGGEEINYNSSDRDDFNSTRVEFFDEENSFPKTSDFSITSARVDLNSFKDLTSQSVNNFVQEQLQFQEMSLPGQQSSVSILPNFEFSQMMDNEMSSGNIPDISVNPSTSKQQTFLFNSTVSNDNMEFTQAIPSNFANLHLSKHTNAEITRSIPPNSNLMRQILNAKRQAEQNTVILNNTQKSDLDMNVTQCLPTSNGKSKRRTILYNEEDLDITSTVDSAPIIDVNKENILMIPPKNLEEMEITQAIPVNAIQLVKSRRQTINYNSENIENNAMEITEFIPAGFNFTNSNNGKNLLANRRTVLQENYVLQDEATADKENILNPSQGTKNRQTIYFNTQSSDSVEMEETGMNNDNMEMTTAIYNKMQLKNNRQTINFNLQNEELVDMNIKNMDVTIANLSNIQQKNSAINRRTINFKNRNEEEDMDITKINPNLQETSVRSIINNENMEITTTIANKLIMEQRNSIQNRQTINFNLQNEESDVDSMRVIPSDINLQQISRLADINIENMQNTTKNLSKINVNAIHFQKLPQLVTVNTANSSKINLQQNNSVLNRQTISLNLQNEEPGVNVINLQQIPHLADANIENMEVATASSSKINVPQKNPVLNRQTISFNLQKEEPGVNVINSQQIPHLADANIENMEVATANSSKINVPQKNPVLNRQTICFNLQKEEPGVNVINLQQIPHLADVNIQNMEVATANLSKTNLQQKNPVLNRQTISFNLQKEEPGVNVIKLQQIPHLADVNIENMEVATANSSKTNLQQKNPALNRQTISFNMQNEEPSVNMEGATSNSNKINLQQKNLILNRQTINFKLRNEKGDTTKINENLQQISDMSTITNENMENARKNNLQPKNKSGNRQTINFKELFNSANTEDIPCIINKQLVNEIPTIVMRHSSVVKEENNTETLIHHNSIIDQQEQLLSNSEVNSTQTVKQENNKSEINDYPVAINLVTKKPCSSSIRHTINLQADESVIIIEDSTASKIIDYKNNTIHSNNINNDRASSGQIISSDETSLKMSPNNTQESSKNGTELSETKMVLNQITDLLKERNVYDSVEDLAKQNVNSSEVTMEKLGSIFHFKGYPLIVNQVANESGKSDICQSIKYLGATEESFHRSKLNFTSYSNPNSCNISKNLSSFVDSTEKLINYKLEFAEPSEYTKIINEEIAFCNISNKKASLESIDELSNIPHKVTIIESNVTSDSDNIIEIQGDKTTEIVERSNTNNLLLSNSIISINSSSDNDSAQKEDDSSTNEFYNSNDSSNEELWRSVVEKSKCYNSEMLSSLDISLVDSLDNSQSPNQFEVSNVNTINEREYKKPVCSVIDKFEELMKIIKNKYPAPKPKILVVEPSRSEYSVKHLGPITIKTEAEPEIVTVEKQIQQKSQYALWNIKELKDNLFSFTFIYKTIEAVSEIETDTGIVKDVKFYSIFSEKKSDPIAVYCYHIVIKKLTRNHIKSAIGSSYTILSLLDYISMIEEQILSILHQFDNLELQYGVDIDTDLNVKMQFTNIYLNKAFEVVINVNKLDNLTEDDIIVTPLVGQIDKFTIKRLVKQCPRGIPLLTAFILNVKEYLTFLQNNR